uniref:Putative organic anion transporting polypeptide n=1 Tax=Rhipicephalus microplus TaxID=6941 RepID=A0A6M2CUL6_RHIMP
MSPLPMHLFVDSKLSTLSIMPTSVFLSYRSSIEVGCSGSCNCTTTHFQPVCDPVNDTVFFSPCHAGCTKISAAESGTVSLESCSCFPKLQAQHEHQAADQQAPYLGLCTSDACSHVMTFIALSSLVGFIVRSTTVAHTIVGLRIVPREEKAMALGVQEGLSSIFTYIPYPMLYGAIFDSACLVWEDKCGKPGVCWLYDTDRLRYAYHGLSVAILLTAIIFELGLVYHSGHISDFYSDPTAPTSSRHKAFLGIGDGSEGSPLVDEQKIKGKRKSEHTEGESSGDEDEDPEMSCSCCKQKSKDQASTC